MEFSFQARKPKIATELKIKLRMNVTFKKGKSFLMPMVLKMSKHYGFVQAVTPKPNGNLLASIVLDFFATSQKINREESGQV